jgi:hypothetical protein
MEKIRIIDIQGSATHPKSTDTTPPVTTEMMPPPAAKRHAVDPVVPVETRSRLIGLEAAGLSQDVRLAQAQVANAAAIFGQALVDIFRGVESFDTGRAIAAIDNVQHTKNLAWDALTLPHVAAAKPPQ